MYTREFTTKAELKSIKEALLFLEDELTGHGCSQDQAEKIETAVEEMLVNIANYAYPEGEGDVVVCISFPKDDIAQVEIRDRGIHYDPTKRPDPDVTKPLRQRSKGGLGIFMAKKFMDEMEYDYRDGVNHTTMRKRLILQ